MESATLGQRLIDGGLRAFLHAGDAIGTEIAGRRCLGDLDLQVRRWAELVERTGGAHSAIERASSMLAAKRLMSELRRSDTTGGVLVIEPAGPLGALVVDYALDNTTTTRVLAASFVGLAGAKITAKHSSHRRSA